MEHDAVGNGEGGLRRPSLARLLDEEGVATRDEVQAALVEGAQTGERLGEVLLRRAVLDEAQLARLLARQWNLPLRDEAGLEPDGNALSLLAPGRAAALGAVPVGWEHGALEVVIAEPSEQRLAAVRRELGTDVRVAVVTPDALTRLLGRLEAVTAGRGPGDVPPPASPSFSTLAELVGELDQGTAKILAVRGRLEQLAVELLERERALASSETELAAARRHADESRELIGALQREVDDLRRSRESDQSGLAALRAELARRNELLAALKAQLAEMAGAFDRFEAE